MTVCETRYQKMKAIAAIQLTLIIGLFIPIVLNSCKPVNLPTQMTKGNIDEYTENENIETATFAAG